MIKSNLIKLLSKLDKSGFEKFGKFIVSPYFNSNKKLIDLYRILAGYFPDFNSLDLSKENIYRKLYGKEKVVYGTMYYLFSEMESLLEKFISLENLKPFTLEMTFLDELTKMRLQNLFDERYRKLKNKIIKHPDEYHLNKLLLSEINRNNSFVKMEFLTKKDLIKNDWTEPASELIKFFIKNSLRNILLLSNYNQNVYSKVHIPMLEETLKYAESVKLFNSDPEIEVIYYQIRLIKEQKEEFYKKLIKYFSPEGKKLNDAMQGELFANLINYLVNKSMTGGGKTNKEIADLSYLYLNNLVKVRKQRIPADTFLQIHINFKAFNDKLIKEYFEKYSHLVEEKHKQNVISFCKADIYYYDGEFDKSLREISGIKNYTFVFLKPFVKVLQLKLLYELDLLSEAADAAKSFKQFLRNDKFISARSKEVNGYFLKFYFKLLAASHRITASKITGVQSDLINHKDFIPYRGWFQNKLKSLESQIYGKSKAI